MKKLILIGALLCGVSISVKAQTKGSEHSCSLQVADLKEMIEDDGLVADEESFSVSSLAALQICMKQAKNWRTLGETIRSARKSCDESANQGMSELYRGTCYLKAAELAAWILP